MQQRQPRLGDIVDDYCPRERRVTNHAIVAMVGDDIRQTRCTTCESEHLYKQARVPPQRRRKDAPGALYQQVLDGAPHRIVAPAGVAAEDTIPENETVPDTDAQPDEDLPVAVGGDQVDEPEGPVHRRLIRATLPRLGNEVPLRREPEFTIRAPLHNRPGKPGKGPKGGGHRVAGTNGHAAGNRPAGKRHGGGASRQPQGGAWSRSGQQGPGQHRAPGNRAGRGGKKRSR